MCIICYYNDHINFKTLFVPEVKPIKIVISLKVGFSKLVKMVNIQNVLYSK